MMFKTHDIDIKRETYDEYHVENNTLGGLILKFMTVMQTVFIANRIFKRKPVPKTEKKGRVNKSDINNISDNSGIAKSDRALSDTEAVIKSKENFYNVVQNITKNMLKEMTSPQKISVHVESSVLPDFGEMVNRKEFGEVLRKAPAPETPVNKSNEIVRESEIQIIVGSDKVKETNEEMIESKLKTGVPEDTLKAKESIRQQHVQEVQIVKQTVPPVMDYTEKKTYSSTNSSKKNSIVGNKSSNKKNENCHCKCLIF
jgi:hypothetical protein